MGDKKKIFKVWLRISLMAAQTQILTNWGGMIFVAGKIIRFLLFFVFLFSVLSSTKTLAGYSREQVIFFFLIFNLVDVATQFLFRGVYRFRRLVVSGDYDLDLVKPLPSYFRPIFGWTDILDLVTLVPLWGYFLWFIFANHLFSSPQALFLFFLLLANSLLLGFSFHLLICAICVLTTEIDHLIWVYRDLVTMARFPTDIYQKGVQYVLTFAVPIIVLITIPAKALLGLLSWQGIGLAFVVSGLFFGGSLRLWQHALSQYSSASS